ncbi:MAG: YceI family protein [Phycisphaeraceae bacterium]|nr:YceI family protein [Phycisphaeraceae bacterium]
MIRSLSVALAAALALLLTGPAAAETYQTDNTHSSVVFGIDHLNISTFYGRFNQLSGDFEYDADADKPTAFNMTVDAESVDTNHKKRDNHLRGPDFFNAKQHPEITFESTEISLKEDTDNVYEVTGNLTMLGETKAVTAEITMTGAGEDPWGGYRRGFTARFTIDRTAFGMNYGTKMLGEEVELTVAVEGVRQ